MNRNDLIFRIEDAGLIAIVRGIKNEYLIDTAEAMYAGGVRVLEIT